MGCENSKLESLTKKKQEQDAIQFIDNHMNLFLESEYCKIEKTNWIDTRHFLLAFQSYIKSCNIKSCIPILNSTDIEVVKWYFNSYKHDDIYVTGSCKDNVIVGVTIDKWPGSKETDGRSPLEISTGIL